MVFFVILQVYFKFVLFNKYILTNLQLSSSGPVLIMQNEIQDQCPHSKLLPDSGLVFSI